MSARFICDSCSDDVNGFGHTFYFRDRKGQLRLVRIELPPNTHLCKPCLVQEFKREFKILEKGMETGCET